MEAITMKFQDPTLAH